MGRGEMGTDDTWYVSERLIDAQDEVRQLRRERDALYQALKDVLEGRYVGKARRLVAQMAPEARVRR